jgi:hypothetical protein
MANLYFGVLLPKYIDDRNMDDEWTYQLGDGGQKNQIEARGVSWIIAIQMMATFLFAPFNTKIKNKLGSRNSVLLGFT